MLNSSIFRKSICDFYNRNEKAIEVVEVESSFSTSLLSFLEIPLNVLSVDRTELSESVRNNKYYEKYMKRYETPNTTVTK